MQVTQSYARVPAQIQVEVRHWSRTYLPVPEGQAPMPTHTPTYLVTLPSPDHTDQLVTFLSKLLR